MRKLQRALLVVGSPVVMLCLLFGAGALLKVRRQKYCQSQLRGLGFALTLYVQDYDGRLPDAPRKHTPYNADWVAKLTPSNYYAPSYLCTSNPNPFDTRSKMGIHITSYVWNDAYAAPNDGLSSPSGQVLSRLLKPQQTVLLADGIGDFLLKWELKNGATLPSEGDGFRLGSIIGRHKGRPNVLFCDGHVANKPVEQVFLPRTQNGRSYFAGLSIEND